MVNSLRLSTQSLVHLSSCLWHQQRLWLLGLPAPHSLSPAHSSQCPNSVNFPCIQRPTAAVEEWLLGGRRSGSKETLCPGPSQLTGLGRHSVSAVCLHCRCRGRRPARMPWGGTSWQIYHSRVPVPRFRGAGTQR